MEVRHLRNFLAVVECGSLGLAARRLKMSQPAMTKSIKQLEALVGVPLFVRSTDGMTLNEFGRLFEQRARTVAIELDRAQIEIREMLGAQRGKVSISVAPSFAGTVLPAALSRFRATHPSVEIETIEHTTDAVTARILEGTLDFAIGTVASGFLPSSLRIEIFYSEPVLIVAGMQNKMAARRLTLEEAWQQPWIISSGTVFRNRLHEIFASINRPAPQPALKFTSISFAKSVLTSTNVLAMLSHSAIEQDVAQGRLRVVQIPEMFWRRNVGVVLRDGATLTPAAAAFLDEIRTACAERGIELNRNKGRVHLGV